MCFTLNNYTAEDEERIQLLAVMPGCACILYGREVGEVEATPHLQGYVEWRFQRTLNQWRAAIGSRAHIEQALGTRWCSWCYCTKEDESPFYRPCDFRFWEQGQKAPKSGKGGGYEEPMRKINDVSTKRFFSHTFSGSCGTTYRRNRGFAPLGFYWIPTYCLLRREGIKFLPAPPSVWFVFFNIDLL